MSLDQRLRQKKEARERGQTVKKKFKKALFTISVLYDFLKDIYIFCSRRRQSVLCCGSWTKIQNTCICRNDKTVRFLPEQPQHIPQSARVFSPWLYPHSSACYWPNGIHPQTPTPQLGRNWEYKGRQGSRTAPTSHNINQLVGVTCSDIHSQHK